MEIENNVNNRVSADDQSYSVITLSAVNMKG